MALSLKRANERLAARGLVPLPEGLTPHSMRRTFISLLLAIGEDVPYLMGQVGHVDPKVTLSIYAQVMFRGEGERERLEALVTGSDWAPLGTSAQSEPVEAGDQLTDGGENLATSRGFDDGRGWFRTTASPDGERWRWFEPSKPGWARLVSNQRPLACEADRLRPRNSAEMA